MTDTTDIEARLRAGKYLIGDDVADAIAQQRAEIARLREALQYISTLSAGVAQSTARQALEPRP